MHTINTTLNWVSKFEREKAMQHKYGANCLFTESCGN